MHIWMTKSIKDRKEDQSQGARNREANGRDCAGLVEFALVRDQLTRMSQPAF